MERFLLLCSCLGAALARDDASSLDTRQTDGAISSTYFLRRGYHASAVLGDKLYIDGGVLSWSSSNGVQYQYSSTLVYVDLSDDFTPSSATVSSIRKPAGAPNAWLSGTWTNDGLLYTGFAGRMPPVGDMASPDQGLWSFEPSADGTDGTWTNLNGTADAYFTTSLRPFTGSVASGNGTGFFLGGQVDYSANDTYQPISGLVTYDFATHKVANTSVTGVSTDGWASYGQMHYVPNFGPAGVVVSAGGIVADDSSTYGSFDTVQVLDPATGAWYEQATTGDAPASRKEFCMAGAASSNGTYEVVVYAGWAGALGADAIPYDDLHVLSLPSFHWFRASYEALYPRHGLTCEHLGGGQVLAVGGVDTMQDAGFEGCFQTQDRHPQGLMVFDLGAMAWADGYVRNRTAYDQSSAVRSYYEENDRMADFTSSALKQVFSVQNFTAAATAVGGSSPGSSAASSSSSSSSSGAGGSGSGSGAGSGAAGSSSSAGAIAGGVVGGVALAAAAIGAAFYFLRRRKRQRAVGEAIRQQGGAHPGDAYKTPYVEMQGQDMKYDTHELPNSMPHEADAQQSHRVELP